MKNTSTAQAVPHHSNYVGKVPNTAQGSAEYEIGLDTLSFTIGSDQFKKKYGFSSFQDVDAENLKNYFQDFLGFVLGINFPLEELRGGRNFFDFSIPFSDDLGFIAFGGNNICKKLNPKTGLMEQSQNEEKIQFYITGAGCSILSKQQFQRLYEELKKLENVSLKRVDIALDCFSGELSLELVDNLYDEGLFTGNGRPPVYHKHSKKNDSSGETVNVGNRTSGKMFRAYEKGKQLGDPSSNWVRFEVEILSKDRQIPLEVLINPVEYFAGSYPALSFASTARQVIKTVKEKMKIQAEQMIIYARTGYGRLIWFLIKEAGFTPEQIVNNLTNTDGYPTRLRWTAHI